MKEWLLSVCAVTIVTSLSVFILPEGKIGIYIKSIFSFITVLVIIAPLSNLSNLDFDFNLNNQNNIQVQTEYLNYFNNKRNEENEKLCEKALEEAHLNFESVKFIYDTTDDYQYCVKKIEIILSKSVIKEDETHIDIIEDIKNKLSMKFLISKTNIRIDINGKS